MITANRRQKPGSFPSQDKNMPEAPSSRSAASSRKAWRVAAAAAVNGKIMGLWRLPRQLDESAQRVQRKRVTRHTTRSPRWQGNWPAINEASRQAIVITGQQLTRDAIGLDSAAHTPQQVRHDYVALAVLHKIARPMAPAMGLQPKGTVAAISTRVAIHAADPPRQLVAEEQQPARVAVRQASRLFDCRIGAE
jgi:hypothetical protein